MFWIKKLVALLISPLGLLLILCAAGLVLHWRRLAGPWPKRLITTAFAGLLLISIGPTGELLLTPLERGHATINDPGAIDDVSHVVVLGGGFSALESRSVTSRLAPASTVRLAEGIRLHRKLDDTTLVVSGASVAHPGSTAEAMAELAVDFGIPRRELALADSALDTAQEALAVREMVAPGDRVIVVTSASHMSRALRLFERTGLDAIAAPTHHLTTTAPFHPGNLWPSAKNVRRVERAIYEYIALVWIALGGS